MKIIVRIALILLAAGLVCGGLILYANNAGASLGELPGGGGEHLRQGMGQSQERQFKNRPEGALPEGSLAPGGGRGLGHGDYGEPGSRLDWPGLPTGKGGGDHAGCGRCSMAVPKVEAQT